MNMKSIFTIAKKEFRAYFLSPIAYVFMVTFLVLNGYFFFRSFFLVGQADARPIFQLMPWFFLFFIPAIAMGKWSEERKLGTIELLFTQPVRDIDVMVGKFLAAGALILISILLTFPIPTTVALLGDIDWGTVIGGYIGLVLLGSAYLAIGLFASTLAESHVVAFILGLVISFILLIIGGPIVTSGIPNFLIPVFQYISMGEHFVSIARGVIDSRDIVYYLSVILFFLWVGLKVVEFRGVRPSSFKDNAAIALSVIIGITVMNYFMSRHFVRFDITEEREFALSKSTKNILKNLDDVVNINLYFSKNLPPELRLLERDVEDVLSEYKSYAGGRLQIKRIDPMEDPKMRAELAMMGIGPLKVGVIKENRQELAEVYLGMAVIHGDKREVIPAVRGTINMEYELTQAIFRVTEEVRPVIEWYSSGDRESYGIVRDFLARRYAVRDFSVAAQIAGAEKPSLIVISADKDVDKDVLLKLDDYLKGGGRVLLMIDKVKIGENLLAEANPLPNIDSWLEKYGMKIDDGLLIDRSNEMAAFRQGYMTIHINYPYWVKVPSSGLDPDNPAVADLEQVVFPWVSPVVIKDGVDGVAYTALAKSTPYGSVVPSTASLLPDEAASYLQSQTSVKGSDPVPLAVIASGRFNGGESACNLLVIGNSRFIMNDYVNRFPANLIFFENSADYLSMQDALIGIRSKGATDRPIIALSARKIAFIKYVNIIGTPLVVCLGALFIILLRRRKTMRLREIYC